MLDFSFIQTVGDIYLFLITSELDSDNCLLNTKMFFIESHKCKWQKIEKKELKAFP